MHSFKHWLVFAGMVMAWGSLVAANAVKDAPPLGEKRVIRGITYATVGTLELKLDLHLPTAKPERPLPVLLWLHAGGWREGGRGFCPIANLAKEGYAVASVSYRLSGQAKFPAQIEDCKAAVRWLRAHAAEYSLDSEHIGACGESAGGHLAALLGVSGGIPRSKGRWAETKHFRAGCRPWCRCVRRRISRACSAGRGSAVSGLRWAPREVSRRRNIPSRAIARWKNYSADR
ncbi:MAG: alpha/beta hydrolase [Magnetospirillum sp.]|nr:alpha/beta hydrolase [Magnetospirillum sp.]